MHLGMYRKLRTNSASMAFSSDDYNLYKSLNRVYFSVVINYVVGTQQNEQKPLVCWHKLKSRRYSIVSNFPAPPGLALQAS
jgi:hypothetical protein